MGTLQYSQVRPALAQSDLTAIAPYMFWLMFRNIASDGFVFEDPVNTGVLSQPGCVLASPSWENTGRCHAPGGQRPVHRYLPSAAARRSRRRRLALLGQDELGTSVFESALRDQIVRSAAEGDWPEQDTERTILAAARVGQHVFPLNVLTNCGRRCVFCGLNPSPGVARRMLLAGHIKPWKDSSAAERLDPRNGLTACPSHDMAFDTGMLTVSADPKIHIARPLADAAARIRPSACGSWPRC
jgi:hypothetical protein